MKAHATLEQLSGYLDEELDRRQQLRIAEHVGECAACRRRLEGLRRVVRQLEGLSAQAPPKHIGRLVGERLGLGEPRRGLLERLEARRRPPGPGALGPMFGVLLALAVIIYLFTFAVARERGGESPGAGEVSPGATLTVETVWRRVGERRFQLTDGVWVEEGVDPESPIERLDAADVAADPELAAALEAVRDLGGTVRLRHGSRVVEAELGH